MIERRLRRCLLLVLCSSLLLCAAATSGWAAPIIQQYAVKHTTLLRSYLPGGEPIPRWALAVGLCMTDSAGVENIAGVTVWDPAGEPPPNENVHWPWIGSSECNACICLLWEFPSEPPLGSYALQAYGEDGSESAVVVTVPFDHFPTPVPEITYPAPGSVITETAPEFTWLAYPGFACEGGAAADSQYVDVSTPDEAVWLWGQAVPVEATSVLYDGPPLEPGHEYTVHLWESRPWLLVESAPWGWYGEETRRDSAFTIYSPDPVIQHVGIVVCRSVGPDGGEWYGDSAEITVFDADGWEDVSVSTVDPNDRIRPGPGDTYDYWNEGQYVLHQAWAQYGQTEPLATGSYEVTAEDTQGNLAESVTATFDEYPPFPDITSPENGSVIADPLPTFTWEDVPGACRYDIYLLEMAPDPHDVWGMSELPPATTSVVYNDDGSASDPELSPGASYLFGVAAYYPDQDPSDRVWISPASDRVIEFTLYSPVPEVTLFEVKRGRRAAPDGTLSYQQWVKAFVTDMDGTEDVKSVTFTDSQDQVHDAWFVCQWDEATAIYCWTSSDEAYPSPAGTYLATAIDQDGNTGSASAQVSAIPEEPGHVPALESPPANYSVAPDPPTFSWSAPLGEGCYCFVMRGMEGECAVWCPPGPVSSPLPYDGSGSILPGHLYEWEILSWSSDDIEQSDPHGRSQFWFTGVGRFWLEPEFIGFLKPINNDGSSIFKLNSTVPVKFQLLNADGSYVSDATATLSIAKVEDQVVGTYQEAVSTAAPDSGNTFRYDPAANQYIFNLGTKNLSVGTWTLQVTVNGEVMKEASISLS